MLLYGAGLRLLEALRLRIKDVDTSRSELTIREAKGNKDRVTVLPECVRTHLARHLERRRQCHLSAVEEGRGRVLLPGAFARKHPSELLLGAGSAVVVEEYPDYPKGAAVLVLQRSVDGSPVHAVWGVPRGYNRPAVLVTAYRPDPTRTFGMRRLRGGSTRDRKKENQTDP